MLDFTGILLPGDPASPGIADTQLGLRSRSGEEFMASLRHVLARYGITRVANLTGYDHVGIPVHMAIKPQGRSLSNGSGKGVTSAGSWISAVMEAAEQTIWEEAAASDVTASATTMRRFGLEVVDGSRLPMLKGGSWSDDIPLRWREGWDLVSGGPVWIPDVLVTCRRNDLSPIVQGSNGLASGSHVLEAILAGLLEVVERDGVVLSNVDRHRLPVDAWAYLEDVAPELSGNIARSGTTLEVYDATSEVGIPTFEAHLRDAPGERFGLFGGAGAAVSARTALIRAVAEAAQSRCVIMAGTREDVTTAQRRVAVDFPTQRDIAPGRSTSMRPHDEASTGTLDGDLELVGAHLAAAGFDHIVVVRLTRPDEVVQVVRVVVPGLEGTRLRNASLGERALRRATRPTPGKSP